MSDDYLISSASELDELIGEPLDVVKGKVVGSLDGPMKRYIERSPLVFVSTVSSNGGVDVSPKGDPCGFTHVDAQGNLIIPERLGNRLTFGFRNLLENDQIGLLFVVPKLRETLRVKGRAVLRRDPEVLQALQVKGKPALMYTYVTVEECFFHCGKAMIRSNMWKPEAWADPERDLMAKQVASTLGDDESLAVMVEEEIEKNYENELY